MPGMYPDEQVLSIFDEEVRYPGLDPQTHKFTNGSFSDPLIKPSRIPAETFNLIIDNISALIEKMGGEPNNEDISQLADLFGAAAIARKGVMRDNEGRAQINDPLNPLDITNKKYVDYKPPLGLPTLWFGSVCPSWALWFDNGNDVNNVYTPYLWAQYPNLNNDIFKDILNTFSANGWMSAFTATQFYVPDLRGMFPRFAGASRQRGTSYNGSAIGTFQPPQLQEHDHQIPNIYGNNVFGTNWGDGTSDTWGFGTTRGGSDKFPRYPWVSWAGSPDGKPVSVSLRLIVRFE